MMPITEIHVGDQYKNPLHRPCGLTWVVLEVNRDNKMIKVQGIDKNANLIGKPIWKSNNDRMFSESWRVFSGSGLFN